MTQTGYTNAIVNVMLGWLKALANWVLKLFNLAGSGGNPLLWLSENWLKLLIVLLVAGVVLDWLVWMIRWRPYWVWFKKKRIIVNDERLLEDDGYIEDDDMMMQQQYVVPSAVVKRRGNSRYEPVQAERPRRKRSAQQSPVRRKVEKKPISGDIFSDDLFEVGHDQEDYSDFYEDEVFNVSSLPKAQETRKPAKRRR